MGPGGERMENGEQTTCAACGWPVSPDDACCAECGADLPRTADATSLPRPIGSTAGGLPPDDPPGQPAVERLSKAAPRTTRPDDPPDALPFRGLPDEPPDDPCFSDCEDFRVEYNAARVFLTGHVSAFNFRVTPLLDDADEIRNLRIRVDSPGFLVKPLTHRSRLWRLRPGRSLPEVHINLEPEKSGQDIAGEVYVTYTKNDRARAFYTSFLWDAYPPSEDSSKVIENLSIRIGDIVTTGDRAGDANTTVSFLDDVQKSGRYSRADELRQLKLPNAWKLLSLYECDATEFPTPPELGPPPSRARANRLTLRTPGAHRIHLLQAQQGLQLGKNRKCDLVTWFMTPDGAERLSDQSALISRFHCRIERGSDGWTVRDGDGTRPSSYGSFLNRKRIPHDRGLPVPENEPFQLTLAGADAHAPNVFCFEGRLWTCKALGGCRMALHDDCKPRGPACLVLRRTDGIPETFVLLWRFCTAAAIGSPPARHWDGACFFRHKDGFGVCTIDHAPHFAWLIPGETTESLLPGATITAYKQFGQWAEGKQ
jgi:hypothetical protein